MSYIGRKAVSLIGRKPGLSSVIAHPVIGLPVLIRVVRIRDLEVLIVASHEVLEDSPALEDTNYIAILILICEGWDTAVRVDLKEPGFLVFLCENVHFDKLENESVSESTASTRSNRSTL